MTPAELRAAGEALYGLRWQSPLARDLTVSDRTMRRWAAAGAPEPVAGEIAALLSARHSKIAALLK